jgi:hypothetical protein
VEEPLRSLSAGVEEVAEAVEARLKPVEEPLGSLSAGVEEVAGAAEAQPRQSVEVGEEVSQQVERTRAAAAAGVVVVGVGCRQAELDHLVVLALPQLVVLVLAQ